MAQWRKYMAKCSEVKCTQSTSKAETLAKTRRHAVQKAEPGRKTVLATFSAP